MTYQMTAAQQEVLDNQCDVLIPDFEPSDKQVKGLVEYLMEGKKLHFPTITLDSEFITEKASEDVQLNLDIHHYILNGQTWKASVTAQAFHLKTATELVREYISDFNQLPRIV